MRESQEIKKLFMAAGILILALLVFYVLIKLPGFIKRKQNKTLRDVIIMASLLEEEVQSTADRKLAAGILWKRLKLGMGLQVDSAPDTYRYRGLPHGPISNPGLDAILAAT